MGMPLHIIRRKSLDSAAHSGIRGLMWQYDRFFFMAYWICVAGAFLMITGVALPLAIAVLPLTFVAFLALLCSTFVTCIPAMIAGAPFWLSIRYGAARLGLKSVIGAMLASVPALWASLYVGIWVAEQEFIPGFASLLAGDWIEMIVFYLAVPIGPIVAYWVNYEQ